MKERENKFYKISDKVAFGGLTELSEDAINLRVRQISENFRLHTDHHYNDSLKIINIASKKIKIKPKLITKLYYNINLKFLESDKTHKFDTIYNQMGNIVNQLEFIPDDWHLQICCNPSLSDFQSDNFLLFKKKIKIAFNIEKIFIETFPNWENNTKKIIKNKLVDGSVFHYNILEHGVIDKIFFAEKYITISPLGKSRSHEKNLNKKNGLSYSEYINKCKEIIGIKDDIDLYIAYFKYKLLDNNFLYAITSVNSLNNFQNLKIRLEKYTFSNEIYTKIEELHNFFFNTLYREDPYGLKNFWVMLIKNRSRIKHNLLSKYISSYKRDFI